MKSMLAPVTHFLPLATIRRKRLLPIPGSVLVRRGQKIGGDDVVAEVNLEMQHLIFDVKRMLKVSGDKVEACIQCKVGDIVDAGDILAGPVGAFRRVIRAPEKGVVVVVSDGQILFEVQEESYQVKAGISGEIVELVPDRGAIVETTGILIQGVWGNQKINTGLLMNKITSPDDVLTASIVDDSNLRGTVVVGGYCDDPEVITLAESLSLKGLALASMAPKLRELAEKANIPIMLIEGFGNRSINPIAFELLSGKDNQEISINAEKWNRFSGSRPELVIPIPTISEVPIPKETAEFTRNQEVRVIAGQDAGKIGIINSIIGFSTLPSAIKARSAIVRMRDFSEIVVPLTNLEVIQ